MPGTWTVPNTTDAHYDGPVTPPTQKKEEIYDIKEKVGQIFLREFWFSAFSVTSLIQQCYINIFFLPIIDVTETSQLIASLNKKRRSGV